MQLRIYFSILVTHTRICPAHGYGPFLTLTVIITSVMWTQKNLPQICCWRGADHNIHCLWRKRKTKALSEIHPEPYNYSSQQRETSVSLSHLITLSFFVEWICFVLLSQGHIFSLGSTLFAALNFVIEPELEVEIGEEIQKLLEQMQDEKPEDRPLLQVEHRGFCLFLF